MTVQAILTLEKPIILIDQLLDVFQEIYRLDYQSLLNLDFDFVFNRTSEIKKIDPIIKVAKPENAKDIAALFKETYKGTYPYKKMEDEEELHKMIKSARHEWFLFTLADQIIGCIGAELSFNEKKGLLHGLVVRNIYQNFVDMLKAFIAVLIYVCKKYENKILIWHGEARTNDTASQFGPSIFGMKPIAFFPNKDLFFNRIESDIMIIAYYNNVLDNLRRKDKPIILRQVLNSYLYSTKRFNLGSPIIENPEYEYQIINSNKSDDKIKVKEKKDKFGNENVIFRITNSKSYMKFFYNPYSKNIENTIYNTSNIEQLESLIYRLKRFIKEKNVRYCECFVSAYKPEHQKVFLINEFNSCGYVPSYKYNSKEGVFEDQIVFCRYDDKIKISLKTIPEVRNLIENLNFKTLDFYSLE